MPISRHFMAAFYQGLAGHPVQEGRKRHDAFYLTLPFLLPFLPDLTSRNVFIFRFRFGPGENHVRPRLISKPESPFSTQTGHSSMNPTFLGIGVNCLPQWRHIVMSFPPAVNWHLPRAT